MNTHDKKHSFFDDSLSFLQAKGRPFISSKMKLLTLCLFLFSGLFLDIKGDAHQVPAKPKEKVVAVKLKLPVAKRKSKAKKVKKVVIQKDTMSEIDPANVNSPLYNKN